MAAVAAVLVAAYVGVAMLLRALQEPRSRREQASWILSCLFVLAAAVLGGLTWSWVAL